MSYKDIAGRESSKEIHDKPDNYDIDPSGVEIPGVEIPGVEIPGVTNPIEETGTNVMP